MKIYKTTDRIKFKIDEGEFLLSPLTVNQKDEIQSLFVSGKEFQGSVLAVKYAVKGVSSKDYDLEFDDSGVLTDACVDDLFNIEMSQKLMLLCASFVNSIPKELVNPQTGEKVEGVKFVNPSKPGKSKGPK